VLAGILPGAVVDLISPAVAQAAGGRVPPQLDNPWLTLVPGGRGAEHLQRLSRARLHHLERDDGGLAGAPAGLAQAAPRPGWDCGFPLADPATQYGAGSFAQPIRRALGGTLLAARERVEMPPPGDPRPARHAAHTEDLAWSWLYLPVAAGVGVVAARLNGLQFLTIRRYLSLVFVSLILLLLGLAIWN
jgi:hypothetical protein